MADDALKTKESALLAAVATTRRGFLTRTAALAGVALGGVSDLLSQAPTCPATGGVPAAGGALVDIKEVQSSNRVLSAIVRVDDEAKGIWLGAANSQDSSGFAKPFCSEKQQMRYFAGSTADGKQFWPVTPGLPAPAGFD